jgi:hypothetical protein
MMLELWDTLYYSYAFTVKTKAQKQIKLTVDISTDFK